jgi:5S rRNA maturation endonuclease (ribonuclease M5)
LAICSAIKGLELPAKIFILPDFDAEGDEIDAPMAQHPSTAFIFFQSGKDLSTW